MSGSVFSVAVTPISPGPSLSSGPPSTPPTSSSNPSSSSNLFSSSPSNSTSPSPAQPPNPLSLLPQLEQAATLAYTSPNNDERQRNADLLVGFHNNIECIPQCRMVLDSSRNEYALLLAASGLLKLVTLYHATMGVEDTVAMKNYLLNYLATHCQQLPRFVLTPLIQCLVRVVKLGWRVDQRFSDVLSDVGKFLAATPRHHRVGLLMMSELVQEMNENRTGESQVEHRRTARGFRDATLLQVFTMSMASIRQVAQQPGIGSDGELDELLGSALGLANACLTFDFIGSMLDESLDELAQMSLQLPAQWRSVMEDASTPSLFYDILSRIRPARQAQSIEVLGGLATARRSIFSSEEKRMSFLSVMARGVQNVLSTQSTILSHSDVFHQFCICLTGDHRVLTRHGWVSIKMVQRGDEVMSFNVRSFDMEWKPVVATVSHPVNPSERGDQLFRMQGTYMDVVATRNHQLLLARLAGRGQGLQQTIPVGYETVDAVLPLSTKYPAGFTCEHCGFAPGGESDTTHRRMFVHVNGRGDSSGYEVDHPGQKIPRCPFPGKHQLSVGLTYAPSQSPKSKSFFDRSAVRSVVCAGINRQPGIKIVIPGLERVCDWWWQKDGQVGFLTYLGFWLGDGYLDVAAGRVGIGQTKVEAVAFLDRLHDAVFPRWWSRHHCTTVRLAYMVRCPPLYEYLRAMAIGPLGYNPMDPASLRAYPHFTADAGLAAAEQKSGYHSAFNTSGYVSTWSQAKMLRSFLAASAAAPGRCWWCADGQSEDDGDDLLTCDSEGCPRGGHLRCAGYSAAPDDWLCPCCEYFEPYVNGVGATEEADYEDEDEQDVDVTVAVTVAVAEDSAPQVEEVAGEDGETVRIPFADAVEAESGEQREAVGRKLLAEGKLYWYWRPQPAASVPVVPAVAGAPVVVPANAAIVSWNNGTFIIINGHWFYLKRWLGCQQQIAAVYSRLSRTQAIALLDGFCRADGAWDLVQYDDSGEPTGSWRCSSSSWPLIDHLQLIGQLAGARVFVSLQSKGGTTKVINGRLATFKRVDHWSLSFGWKSSQLVPFATAQLAKPVDVSADVNARGYHEYVDDGWVYCLTVQSDREMTNANFLTQRISVKRIPNRVPKDSEHRREGDLYGIRAHSVFVGNCLARLKTNYPLPELSKLPIYEELISLIANFTLSAFKSSSSPNSLHYLLLVWSRVVADLPYLKVEVSPFLSSFLPSISTVFIQSRLDAIVAAVRDDSVDEVFEEPALSDQLKSLPALLKYNYGRSKEWLKAAVDRVMSEYSSSATATAGGGGGGASQQQVRICEGQLAMLIFMWAAIIGWEKDNPQQDKDTSESYDAELCAWYFQSMPVVEYRLSYQPNPPNPASSPVLPQLAQASLYFLQQFRIRFMQQVTKTVAEQKESDMMGEMATGDTATLSFSSPPSPSQLNSMGSLTTLVYPLVPAYLPFNFSPLLPLLASNTFELEYGSYNSTTSRGSSFFHKLNTAYKALASSAQQQQQLTKTAITQTSIIANMLSTCLLYLNLFASDEQVVAASLELLENLSLGYASSQLLSASDPIKTILQSHRFDAFSFLTRAGAQRARLHSSFYVILGRILFKQSNVDHFDAFMAPFTAAFDALNSMTNLRSDASAQATVALTRKLQGLLEACVSYSTYLLIYDFLYPSYMPVLLRLCETFADHPVVSSSILHLFAELVYNRAQRIRFDTNSPNGIILFRETSKLLTIYAHRLLAVKPEPGTEAYKVRIKGASLCLTALGRALSGGYVNFGVMQLYEDSSLVNVFQLMLKLIISLQLNDLLTYPQLTEPYFAFLEVAYKQHMGLLIDLDSKIFLALVSSLHEGLQSFNIQCSTHCSTAIDYLFSFVLVEGKRKRKLASYPKLLKHLQQQGAGLTNELLYTLLTMYLFDNVPNGYSISRPIFTLLCYSQESWAEYRERLVRVQLGQDAKERVARLMNECLQGVHLALEHDYRVGSSEMKDKFLSQLTAMKNELSQFAVRLS